MPGENRFSHAHRTAFQAFYGPIPDGLQVLHSCDNRLCINPLHMSLGTHRDNAVDREAKGRGRYGPNAPGTFGRRVA